MAQQNYGEWMRSNPSIPNLTAVETLELELLDVIREFNLDELFQKIKEMEKKQIIKAYTNGSPEFFDMAEEYYNETYGGQGSPDTSPNTKNK